MSATDGGRVAASGRDGDRQIWRNDDLQSFTPLRFMPRQPPKALACPRCESTNTERISAFGATACKALWRCKACGEPFEHFKPI